MKKFPEPEDEHSETAEAGDMALESFRYFEISRTASIIQMAFTFLFKKIAPKKIQFRLLVSISTSFPSLRFEVQDIPALDPKWF